jgi:2-C-methyl-D-erythritol 2,4-cyclodiphosphate synthase
MKNIRIGTGLDVHAFAKNRKLILGGVCIPHSMGLAGHSDADVLVHSIMDALLGAASLGDIGTHFPDTDEKYKNINSLELLKNVYSLILNKNWDIINIDNVIICERPKIYPFISQMKKNISEILNNIDINCIGIKATTTEGLGFVGRQEGIAVQSVVLLHKKS